MSSIGEEFERTFRDLDLEAAIDACALNELAQIFVSHLRCHQPVLEAGCGSGKWVHYLTRRGIACVGIDWSDALQRRSRDHDATVRFDVGDLRNLPYSDNSFGAVLALGSIEHVIEGPQAILAEFRRVLRPRGIAIITVPYFSPVRRLAETLKEAFGVRASTGLRRLGGRPLVRTGSRREVLARRYSEGVWMDLALDSGEYIFYQYAFPPEKLERELRASGLEPRTIFPTASAYGVYRASMGICGTFDQDRELVCLNSLGRVVDLLVSPGITGHMLYALSAVAKTNARGNF